MLGDSGKTIERVPIEFEYEKDEKEEIAFSSPTVSGASLTAHTSGYTSDATDYTPVILISVKEGALVLSVRDTPIRDRRDMYILTLSTLLGLGLAILVDRIGKVLIRDEHQ
jgi:hypothetical protein